MVKICNTTGMYRLVHWLYIPLQNVSFTWWNILSREQLIFDLSCLKLLSYLVKWLTYWRYVVKHKTINICIVNVAISYGCALGIKQSTILIDFNETIHQKGVNVLYLWLQCRGPYCTLVHAYMKNIYVS